MTDYPAPPTQIEELVSKQQNDAISEGEAAVPKSKIVCTIGPASRSEEQLHALIQAGADVVRLNFSHGTRDEHAQVIERVRRIAEQLNVPVAILQDLAGPKVRIGTFTSGSVTLTAGAPFTLTTQPVAGTERIVSVSYAQLPQEVKPRDTLLLADGAVILEVQQVTTDEIHCQVVVGGNLSAHKGVNCPSGLFKLPILNAKDLADLQFGIDQQLDYIGLSFVRTADDIRVAKSAIAQRGGNIPIIAKIETQTALSHIDEIIAATDGVMVARGDLGIETPFARVPLVQKQLIAKANQQAKPVITATQMLWSMVNAPRPTRAEAADVANAVLDGTDAVMLSEETAVGRYAVQAVQAMVAIADEAEHTELSLGPRADLNKEFVPSEAELMAQAACHIAAACKLEAIVTVTLEGTSARLVAKYRPSQPIFAATPRIDTYRRLALIRGVTPLLLHPNVTTREEMIAKAKERLQALLGQTRTVMVFSSVSAEHNMLFTDQV
jgi:pyruvate kinase